MSNVARDLQKQICDRGLADCKKQLAKAHGSMVDFYKGALIGFTVARYIADKEEFETTIDKLNLQENKLFIEIGPNPRLKTTKTLWFLRGITEQITYTYERLRLLWGVEPRESVSARAMSDVGQMLLKHKYIYKMADEDQKGEL